MKKKILVILPYFPYPLNSGGNIAIFEMINYLRYNHSITILALNSSVSNVSELKQKWENVDIRTYSNESFIQLLIKRISKVFLYIYLFCLSLIVERKNYANTYLTTTLNPYLNPNLIKLLKDIQLETVFDFIQVEFYELLPLIHYINTTSQTIFIHHELRFVRYQRACEMNQFNKLMLSLIKGQEIEFLKQYNRVVTVSDFDRQILENDLNSSNLSTSTLTIRIQEKKIVQAYKFNRILTFLGGSEHYPNKDGILWFLENCWNELIEQSDFKLNIIGNWSKNDIKLLKKYKNVHFLGFVENLEHSLKNTIMIVPIRIGSGMRMKIIEAANYGIPFITTSVGVEGLDFIHNHDCIIADGAEAFIQEIIELSNNTILQNTLIQNAYNTIETKYNSNTLFNKRNQLYT
jgi:glycosyltransferase involved in cell wall biosynthesis